MTQAGLLIIAIFLCLLGNGFFSGSEIAIISAKKSRIEASIAEGSRAARRLKDLQEDLGDSGKALDGYRAILENFIRRTRPKQSSEAPSEPPAP